MAGEAVRVVLTDRARADSTIRLGAFDSPAQLEHFIHARNILKSLKDPGALALDQPMINDFAWMQSRSEGTTYVYYGRNVCARTVVVIHLCEGTTNIYTLLAEIVFSGKTEILTALGICPPPLSPSHSIRIH